VGAVERLHVVDGTYELFRAHFSKRPGAPEVKATAGLLASMAYLLADESERVTHLAVAFDNPIRSFRNDLFVGYKTDEGVPPELLGQFDLAEEAVRAAGCVVWSMDHFEADDALATAAARWQGEVGQVRIMTPDKDLGQAIRGRKVILVDRMRKREIDEDALVAARGIRPSSVPDWLALVGDSADGIPGIPGFGEKTASAILAVYEQIERIPEESGRWSIPLRGAERLGSTLAARRADALLYKKLATLVCDVPLAETLDELAWRGPDTGTLEKVCKRIGAPELARTWPRPR
jgi:5'-3' exonuclease